MTDESMLEVTESKRNTSMCYRWNPIKGYWEWFDDMHYANIWRRSAASSGRSVSVGPDCRYPYLLLTYEDTWCEDEEDAQE